MASLKTRLGWMGNREKGNIPVCLDALDEIEKLEVALRSASDALEVAKNGLGWYADMYPESLNGCDDEATEQINAALALIAPLLPDNAGDKPPQVGLD